MTDVWISPSATAYSCLCEQCLEEARVGGMLFAEALRIASVRGSLAVETDVAVASCAAGHQLVLRRVARPPGLAHPDERQLQIA